MGRLRMQILTIIGQGAGSGDTGCDPQTQDEDLLYRFEFLRQNMKTFRSKSNNF